jgi:hypothetical protein
LQKAVKNEVYTILANAHSNGDKSDPLILPEVEDISLAINRETKKGLSWKEFFTSPSNPG